MANSTKKFKRKNLRTILAFLLSLFSILIISLGIYLNHYNYWPFQNNKVAGVPDNQLVQVDNQADLSSLLFAYGSQLKFNTTATSLTVYFDHYRNGELNAHENVASLEYDQETSLNGYLNLGISKENNQLLIDLFSNGAMSQTTTDLADYDFPLNKDVRQLGGVLTIENGKVNLQENKKIPLLYLAEGNEGLKIYDDMENNLATENLKTLSNAYVIYLELN
jgi:hypothetical protein